MQRGLAGRPLASPCVAMFMDQMPQNTTSNVLDLPGLDPLLREALAFVVRLTSGDATEADATALKGWRATGQDHERAYREAVRLWRDLGTVKSASHNPFAQTPVSRRGFLRSGALAASVAGLAVVAGGYGVLGPSMGALFADFRTGVGERRTVALPDGSRVELNTRTALSVRYTAGERRIELVEGEALFTVSPDKARPFVVQASEGTTTAVGTVFSVHRTDGHVAVTCVEGIIDVAAGSTARLTAGQQIRYGRTIGPVQEVDPQIATAWSKGLLIFRDERLGTVIEQVGRYRSGWIIIADPKRAEHKVTGVFHLDRPEELLRHIEQTLGLSETRITNRLIVLS
ncbi:FecR family protein [Lacibacterium aquatile]|uniref:FecR family protein n=1 Tax=Lacibacterium aquatile TaxID=1168082 RepID=A0ABW5DXH2_9PROT